LNATPIDTQTINCHIAPLLYWLLSMLMDHISSKVSP
jgi:hypothetical protein